jgi:hypothetical protein
MRTMLGAIALTAGLGLAGISTAAAASVGSAVRVTDGYEGSVQNVHYGPGRYCERCAAPAFTRSSAAKSVKAIAGATAASAEGGVGRSPFGDSDLRTRPEPGAAR